MDQIVILYEISLIRSNMYVGRMAQTYVCWECFDSV